jgi:uncharacterized membrane protein YczE
VTSVVAAKTRFEDASLVGRVAMFMAGSVLSTYCYAMTIRANLGLGPLFAFQDGVARTTGIALGTSVTLVGVGMIILAALFRSWPCPGTIVLPFFTGAILAPLLRISPTWHGYLPRLVLVIVATWFMALGGAFSIRCAFGASAYSQLMLCLQRFTRWRIVFAQLTMEVTMLTLGWVLGGSIGIGTLMTGLLIGPGLQFWLRRLGGVPLSAQVSAARPTQELREPRRPEGHEPGVPEGPLAHIAELAEMAEATLEHYSDDLESAISESPRPALSPRQPGESPHHYGRESS